MTAQAVRFTLSDARKLPGPVVYALEDEGGVFYIGRTRNPKRRFHQHATRTQDNIYLTKRLLAAGDGVRVTVVETKPENLIAAELAAIRVHGPSLVNLHSNPARLRGDGGGIAKACCPQCWEPIERRRERLCDSCTSKLLNRGGSSKDDLRQLAAQAVKDFKRSA